MSEPAASKGSSTGRTTAGRMAAGTAHARWGFRAGKGAVTSPAPLCGLALTCLFMKTKVSLHACNTLLCTFIICCSPARRVSGRGGCVGVFWSWSVGRLIVVSFYSIICHIEAVCRR